MEQGYCAYLNANTSSRTETHVLVIPYPGQGHVAPLMKLAEYITNHGVKVTFLTTEFTLTRMMDSMQEGEHRVRLVSVPDGLESGNDRKDEAKVAASIFKVMPGHVYEFIEKANQKGNDDSITCLLVDAMFGWALETAEKTAVKLAMFWSSSPGTLALSLRIPELIKLGLVDSEGTLLRKDKIQLWPDMPGMVTEEVTWYSPPDPTLQKVVFDYFCAAEQVVKQPKWLLCNWFHELNPKASSLIPNIVPVGPLLGNGQSNGTLRPEDSTCINWLDQQPFRSVLYIAFGSISTLSTTQLHELASGLELSRTRFIWVVRPGLTRDSQIKYPDGFEKRVSGYGKIVQWAPQENVLAHPSVACFLTHCGWNSTMEGISYGVPLLCWPCFADQLYIRTCVCDAWKVGLSFGQEENGVISRFEIKKKIHELLSRDDIRVNSLKLKEAAGRSIAQGGSSFNSLQDFIKQIKG